MAAEHEAQGFLREAGSLLTSVYRAVMEGGEVQAFVRQGFGELGNFFANAFPPSLTVDEPGAVFNPLHSDLAADKRAMQYGQDSPALPSPSEIAADRQSYPQEQERGREQGREM